MIPALWHNPIFHGAVSGLVAAVGVDLHAFVTWRTTKDFSQWDWRTALLRWGQGLVTGALGAGLLASVGA